VVPLQLDSRNSRDVRAYRTLYEMGRGWQRRASAKLYNMAMKTTPRGGGPLTTAVVTSISRPAHPFGPR